MFDDDPDDDYVDPADAYRLFLLSVLGGITCSFAWVVIRILLWALR